MAAVHRAIRSVRARVPIEIGRVAIDPAKVGARRAKRRPAGTHGIVPALPQGAVPSGAASGADWVFNNPGDAPAGTTSSDGGGARIGNAALQLIFWGNVWTDSATTPSAGDVVNAVDTIVSGPYISALSQYGVFGAHVRGAFIVTSPDPPSSGTFSDSDIQGLLSDLIDNGDLPEPDGPEGPLLNCFFMPVGFSSGGPNVGEHTFDTDYDFPVDSEKSWYMWVTNDGALTNGNSIPRIFSHELVEACTDPEGDGIQVDPRNGSSWHEIGDVCASTHDLDGVLVQSYWSQRDQACIVPGGPVITGKVTLPDTATGCPALAASNGSLLLAWTGTDSAHSLNVERSSDGVNFGGKVTLGETSLAGPAMVCGNGTTYLAWTGTDSASSLNVISSLDLANFGNKVTLGEQSSSGPALAYGNGRLYLAWTGTDGRLNVMSSIDGVSFGDKVTLAETSNASPGLVFANSNLILVWQGTDVNQSLNLLRSADGINFGNKVTIGESSALAPAMADVGGLLGLCWTGVDSDRHLNLLLSPDGGTSWGSKRVFADTAIAAPALVDWAGTCWIAWTGTNQAANLNVAQLA